MKNLMTKMNRLTCRYKAGHSFNSPLAYALGCVLFGGLTYAPTGTYRIDTPGAGSVSQTRMNLVDYLVDSLSCFSFMSSLGCRTRLSTSSLSGAADSQQGCPTVPEQTDRTLLAQVREMMILTGYAIEAPTIISKERIGSNNDELLMLQRGLFVNLFPLEKDIIWGAPTPECLDLVKFASRAFASQVDVTNCIYPVSNLRNGAIFSMNSMNLNFMNLEMLDRFMISEEDKQSIIDTHLMIVRESPFLAQDLKNKVKTFGDLFVLFNDNESSRYDGDYKYDSSSNSLQLILSTFVEASTEDTLNTYVGWATLSLDLNILSGIISSEDIESMRAGGMSRGNIIRLLAKHAKITNPIEAGE